MGWKTLKYGKYELIYGEKTNNLEKKYVRVRIFKKLIKSGAQNDLKGTLNYGLKNVEIWKICANLWIINQWPGKKGT